MLDGRALAGDDLAGSRALSLSRVTQALSFLFLGLPSLAPSVQLYSRILHVQLRADGWIVTVLLK